MIKKLKKKFLRADTFRLSRIGKRRKKLQKWRRPRGKHNKLRLKRFGHPVQPGIGYATQKSQFGKIQELSPIVVNNLQELYSLNKNNIAIISKRTGAKKKMEIIKKAYELNIKIANAGGKK